MVCVFAVDLDGFKNVNDRYGHPTGDHVLKQTAARIQATMGPGAVIARTGGEEFVAIDLLEPPSAPVVAERLRHAIAAATDPPVTASIGVAVTATHDLPSSHEIIPLLAYADAVMYHAKHQGGNTITVHSFTACADVMGDPEGKPHK
jgi:diguanylate cyclase (GGDEF)-like protein